MAEAVRRKLVHASNLLTAKVTIRTLFLAQTSTHPGMAMNYTKIGKRLVVIAGSAPAAEATGVREPTAPRPKVRRIVVIRDGQSVGRRRRR
jgi:hypothetical protein